MAIAMKPHSLSVRTAWISDVHLGHKDCKAEYLIEFLDTVRCEKLYLVGDIIDIWSLSKSFHWPAVHSQVIRKVIDKAREGCQVIYIPGNHDCTFREYVRESFGSVEVHDSHIHTTKEGKRFLVVHGDELDSVIRFNALARFIGDHAYDFLLFLNRWINVIRKHTGHNYWSLAGYIKSRIGNAKSAIDTYERAAMELAKKNGFDGIICGHIHHPNIRTEDNIHYFNDGDWIENCTAMVETREGKFEIIHWSEQIKYQQQLELIPLKMAS